MEEETWLAAYNKMLEERGPTFDGIGYSRRGCMSQYVAIRENLGVKQGDLVLDVGCGIGMGLFVFSDCEYLGIDASGEMIRAAGKLHGEPDLFRCARPLDLFPEMIGKYDWVVMSGIFNIHYGWGDVVKTVNTCQTLAKQAVAVTFLRNPRNRRPEHSDFSMQKWCTLGFLSSPYWKICADWAENAALLVVYGQKEERRND